MKDAGKAADGDKSVVGLLEHVFAEVRSGLVSSVVAEAALFPLDVVKLQQQVHGGGMMLVLRRVLREHGAAGLYKGLLGRLIQTITSNVGFFVWQTIAMQEALRRFPAKSGTGKLSTGVSLIVNMLAQQFNRILTTPVDVVANVNQADPQAKGFFHTFLHLARTGGRATLWRGLPVTLILSFNPALMFTLVSKLSAFFSAIRKIDGPLSASDMFWISGISKTIATLVTYPLIKAKATQQTIGTSFGLWATLVDVFKREGMSGLYSGVWILSYKTVLFNSLMMALKHKIATIDSRWKHARVMRNRRMSWMQDGGYRQNVSVSVNFEKPWAAAANGATVAYVDGSWCFLHEAQEHMLREASKQFDYVVVGVHSDECHQASIGSWPAECYAARVSRLRTHQLVAAILENAPWEVDEDLMRQLGITAVLSGTPITKLEDCSQPRFVETDGEKAASDMVEPVKRRDPYQVPKEQGAFVEIPNLNRSTEYDVWIKKTSRVFFSNVDASIDWRILVRDGGATTWGENPGYESKPGHETKKMTRQVSA